MLWVLTEHVLKVWFGGSSSWSAISGRPIVDTACYFFLKGMKSLAAQALEESSEESAVIPLQGVLPLSPKTDRSADDFARESTVSSKTSKSSVLSQEPYHKEKEGRDEVVSSGTPITPPRAKATGKLLASKPILHKKEKKQKAEDSRPKEETMDKKSHKREGIKDGRDMSVYNNPNHSDAASSASGSSKQRSKKANRSHGLEDQQLTVEKKNKEKTALVQSGKEEAERGHSREQKNKREGGKSETSREGLKSRRDERERDSNREEEKCKMDESEKESSREEEKSKRDERVREHSREEVKSRRDEKEKESSREQKQSSREKQGQKKNAGIKKLSSNEIKEPLSRFSTPLLLDGEIIVILPLLLRCTTIVC